MLQVVLISINMNIIWILSKQSPKVSFDNCYILILAICYVMLDLGYLPHIRGEVKKLIVAL